MSTREAAERLGVARTTITRMIERGDLAPVLQGPGIRGAQFFDPADVEALAVAREKKARK